MISKQAARLTLPIVLLFAGQAWATDLRITDISNTTIVVRDAVIDYGTFSNDKEADGIRVYQGEAVVSAKWVNVDTLTITTKDETVKPIKMNADIMMKNRQRVTVTLLSKGKMQVSGKTDLGDYTIELSKVKSIAPIPSTTTPATKGARGQ